MPARSASDCPCPSRGQLPTILRLRVDLDEAWAADLHWDGDARTPLGDLLHLAKPYNPGECDRAAADQLAACMAWWAQRLATSVPDSKLGTVTTVCCVPANPPKQPYNLPSVLGAATAAALGRPFEEQLVRKTRPTSEAKWESDAARKRTALADAFEIVRYLHDESVLLVDDVALSDATLEEIGSCLRRAGASRIAALVATRATKGLLPRHHG